MIWYGSTSSTKNFSKLRIIEKPEDKNKKITWESNWGRREAFISAVKSARSKALENFTPPKEDCYTVIVSGLLEYMPVEKAIQDIYGSNQDMFCFFNCFFFYEKKISLLCSYFTPHQLSTYTIKTTDCFLFPFNRNFPLSYKDFPKIKTLVETKKLENIVILENTFVPHDMEELANHLDDEEFEEFKEEIEKDSSEKFPEIDEFISDHPNLTYLKVDCCSNESINEVFHTLIEVSQKSKKEIDIHSQLVDEAELVKKIKETPVADANMKALDDLNGGNLDEKKDKKKCIIF